MNLAFQLHFLTTRLESTARRINTPYHQGSLSSETRLCSSTLSRQGNLASSPPTPVTMPTKLFFPAPFSASTNLADSYFSSFASKFIMGQQRPISYNRVFTLKQREERRIRHNTIRLDLSHFYAPAGWTSTPLLLVRQYQAELSACNFDPGNHRQWSQNLAIDPFYYIFEHKRNESLFTVNSSLVTADLF